MINSVQRAEEKRRAWEVVDEAAPRTCSSPPSSWRAPRSSNGSGSRRSALFVIDEAHCVSAVGPRLPARLPAPRRGDRAAGHPPVLALTATAAPPVRADIARAAGAARPGRGDRGVRPAQPAPGGGAATSTRTSGARAVVDRAAALARRTAGRAGLLRHPPGTEDLAEALRGRGIAAEAYHAGLGRAPARRGARAVHSAATRRRRRHLGLRHGHRQARRALRAPRRLARLARRLLPAGRTGGARRRARGRRAAPPRPRHGPAAVPDRATAEAGQPARRARRGRRRGPLPADVVRASGSSRGPRHDRAEPARAGGRRRHRRGRPAAQDRHGRRRPRSRRRVDPPAAPA